MKPVRRTSKAVKFFREAEVAVRLAGFGWETDWQRSRATSELTERDFLREAAWVVLCSGFRESVVRGVFDYVSLCFCDWEAAEEISRRRDACVATASWRFRNERKLVALVDIADRVSAEGFDPVLARLRVDPIRELQAYPFLGPVTSFHLAKNLGFNVAKNDRHLARMASHHGYEDAHELCRSIAEHTGELASVIDVVLWRFAALQSQQQLSFQLR